MSKRQTWTITDAWCKRVAVFLHAKPWPLNFDEVHATIKGEGAAVLERAVSELLAWCREHDPALSAQIGTAMAREACALREVLLEHHLATGRLNDAIQHRWEGGEN